MTSHPTSQLPRTRHELLTRIESSWRALRARLDKLTPDQCEARLADGRTVRETLAGIAFWNETCAPVFAWMRGQPEVPVEGWYGGTDLGIAPGEPWPRDDVHHAREAAWARSVALADVRARVTNAHAAAVAAINTVTDEESAAGREPGSGPDGARLPRDDVPADHPWARLTNAERMIDKARTCTYGLYDELLAQLRQEPSADDARRPGR